MEEREIQKCYDFFAEVQSVCSLIRPHASRSTTLTGRRTLNSFKGLWSRRNA